MNKKMNLICKILKVPFINSQSALYFGYMGNVSDAQRYFIINDLPLIKNKILSIIGLMQKYNFVCNNFYSVFITAHQLINECLDAYERPLDNLKYINF